MRDEHRITNLEKLALNLGTRIEESSGDTAEELRAIRRAMHQGFEQAHAYIKENIEATMATKEDLSKLRDELKADIKSELIAMEGRLLDAIKQLRQERQSGDQEPQP
jgi:predicted  nucleic acid-binding Zn-ribbon protein